MKKTDADYKTKNFLKMSKHRGVARLSFTHNTIHLLDCLNCDHHSQHPFPNSLYIHIFQAW